MDLSRDSVRQSARTWSAAGGRCSYAKPGGHRKGAEAPSWSAVELSERTYGVEEAAVVGGAVGVGVGAVLPLGLSEVGGGAASKPGPRARVAVLRQQEEGDPDRGQGRAGQGQGLVRVVRDRDPKNPQGAIALPGYAVDMLDRRRERMEQRKRDCPPPIGYDVDLIFSVVGMDLAGSGERLASVAASA